MKLQAVTLNPKFLEQGIQKQIIDAFDKDLFYVIPENYWKRIINELYSNTKLNNEVDIINILDILTFLINNKFHSSILLKKISKHYIDYLKFLSYIKIIINYDAAINNQKSRTYNLSNDTGSITILFNDDKREIIYEGDYNDDDNKLPVELPILYSTKINIEKAIYVNYIISQKKMNPTLALSMRLHSIFRFINNKKAFISTKCGRLFSSFTELSKESRKCLHDGNHNYFHEIDMKNCAPTILANRLGIDGDLKKDTGTGVFYEKLENNIKKNGGDKWYYFADKKQLSFKNREDIKKMVCASILYGNITNKILMSSFNELYPVESLILNNMKNQYSNSEFANQNMRIESEIFLNLNTKVKHFSCHDAIYFIGEENKEEIEKEIKRKMEFKFGHNTIFELKFNHNDMNDVKLKINKVDNNIIFIFKPVSEIENKVKECITKGIISNKKINEITGVSLASIKRIKNKLK